MAIINMQTMRYLNLLNNVSHVKTSKCFVYNNTIIFAVHANLVSRAIGPAGKNVRIIQDTLQKKVKIVKELEGEWDASRFIKDIVEPVEFRSLDVNESDVVLNAGSQSKAMLIGRNKIRLIELSQIVQDTFGKELKIV